jgi:ACS family sodium-dependent inorganic phosphate cotransporter-like MFS transporter 5
LLTISIYTFFLIFFFFYTGLLAPAILMSCIGLVGCNYVAAVVLLTFAVGLGGFCMGGFNVNHLDLAPNFSGML